MKSILIQFFVLSFIFSGFHLEAQVDPTPASQRLRAFESRMALRNQSLVRNLQFENIGPTIFSGRVVDVEVNPDDPTHFYTAYASGGLWFTDNNGTTLEPLFDHEAVMTIGDIAVDWERNIIWVGTGENNSSRSSYSGIGIYRSNDGGETWTHMGLAETHHISRIILHPKDPNTLWVAALGALYSQNEERGVYQTTDGGRTWNKVLYVNENTGAADLVIDPRNPNVLFAATWERERRAWDFNEGGEGSGIYRSDNGGKSWKLVSGESSGFPNGSLVGRIGLDMYHQKGRQVIYALLDNYNRRPPEDKEEEGLTKTDFEGMSADAFAQLEEEALKDFLETNDFPEKYSVKEVKRMVADGEIEPVALKEYLEDANSLLFDTPVIGAELYRSTDKGNTWQKMNEDFIDFLYNSYGYYFGQVRVSPQDPEKIYLLGVPILKSEDGGRTFTGINGDNVHSDHHALWVNPHREGHLVLGNDGGLNISWDDGETWTKQNNIPVGQFYSVAVDMAQPYNVYGGLQDNGVWMGPHTYTQSTRWHSSGQYPFKSIMGGDGMQVAVDTRDNKTVYTGFQFGNYYRVNTASGDRKSITPKHELGARPYRWNWETPIWLSVHNQDIFYMGANKLLRSFNQGDDFAEISEDLTGGGKKGDVPFGTLTTVHESPLKFGLIYTGSDDGYVHVTRDGGYAWKRINDGLPQGLWVASVQASAYEEGRVYLSLNGYRNDHFEPYCYISEDYGDNWKRIGTDLPDEPVNVLKEDPKNENILYAGTDHGAYISLDRGASFMAFGKSLPDVPVHDLVVHPRESHLILATHGRSFYKADVKEVQELTVEMRSLELVAFDIDDVRYSERWGSRFANWREPNTPEAKFAVYSKDPGEAVLQIRNGDDLILKEWNAQLNKGLNFIPYDFSIDADQASSLAEKLNKEVKKEKDRIEIKKADDGKYYLMPAEYEFVVRRAGATASNSFQVKDRRRR